MLKIGKRSLKKRVGVLVACIVSIASLGGGTTASADVRGTETNGKFGVNYWASQHAVTTKAYYPVSSNDKLHSVVAGVNYKVYSSGKSGSKSGWRSYEDDISNRIVVYNGVPCYYAEKSITVASNKYIAAIYYYGCVSFDSAKSSLTVRNSRNVTW